MRHPDISFSACRSSRIRLFVSMVLICFVLCSVFWMLFYWRFFKELRNIFRLSFSVYEHSPFFILVLWIGVFMLFVCGGGFSWYFGHWNHIINTGHLCCTIIDTKNVIKIEK
jgi:hypothetical protein